jgi:hypothetical protein
MNFRHATAAILAATTAIVAPANAQIRQTSVKVDNMDCTVTEMPAGRSPTHLVQLAGPAGAAMISVDRENKITAYLSPPGGGEYKPLIDKVWAAYLDQKNGGASTNSTPAPAPADPNVALRAQAAAINAQVQARMNGSGSSTNSGERAVIGSASGGGVIVHDPILGRSGGVDVTISLDGMKGTWILDPGNGAPPIKYTAEFEGGDNPASGGAKFSKAAKGLTTATLNSYNTRADAAVDVSKNPDNDWRIVTEGSNGKRTIELGGFRQSTFEANTGRDPVKDIAEKQLEAVKLDVLAAQEYKGADGNPVVVLTGERSQRGWTALDKITKAYDIQ